MLTVLANQLIVENYDVRYSKNRTSEVLKRLDVDSNQVCG